MKGYLMKASIIALVIAHDGYQATEYSVPKEMLEAAGFTVITISNEPGTATATDGSTTSIDSVLEDLDVHKIDGLFFIGGSGALQDLDTNLSHQRIQEAAMLGIPLGGICIAPRILAKAGALVAKEATGWNGDGLLEEIFTRHGVFYTEQEVVTDGNCITASGPHAAQAFGQAILEIM